MHTPEIDISDNAKICYATTSDKDITKSLMSEHNHLAALRFAYATVAVEGISVACQNQVVRSPHLAYMVQSKRYVNASKGGFEFIMPADLKPEHQDMMTNAWEYSFGMYEMLLSQGVKKQDARAILPANTSTKMNITGNLQAWYDFFVLRLTQHAQLEIRELAEEIYCQLAELYPQVFTQDLKVKLREGK